VQSDFHSLLNKPCGKLSWFILARFYKSSARAGLTYFSSGADYKGAGENWVATHFF
jgi:hypothetical protein